HLAETHRALLRGLPDPAETTRSDLFFHCSPALTQAGSAGVPPGKTRRKKPKSPGTVLLIFACGHRRARYRERPPGRPRDESEPHGESQMEGMRKLHPTCPGPLRRREFLRLGLIGLAGLTWTDLLRQRAAARPVRPQADTTLLVVW